MRSGKLPGMDFAADLAQSIQIIRDNAPADGSPYYGLFSGGKDSIALKAVAAMAGVPVAWHYNVTTVDPPELVCFIRRHHPEVVRVPPKHGPFFKRAAEVKGFPTRRARWCCAEYKEGQSPKDVTLLMGIRAQESPARAARWGHVTAHRRTGQRIVNPILFWDAEDLWTFIRSEGLAYPALYDEGWIRIGCIGCPMSRAAGKARDFARWPSYRQGWERVFRRTWERRSGTMWRGLPWFGDRYFRDWQEMFDWWCSDRALPCPECGDGGDE